MAYLLHIWTYIWKQKYILHHKWIIKLVSAYIWFTATLISQLWIPKRGLNAAAIEQTDYRVPDKTETGWAALEVLILQHWYDTGNYSQWPRLCVFSCQLLGCLQDQNQNVKKQMLDLNTDVMFSLHASSPPRNVFRESYRRKGSILTCSRKSRSTGSIK